MFDVLMKRDLKIEYGIFTVILYKEQAAVEDVRRRRKRKKFNKVQLNYSLKFLTCTEIKQQKK